MAEPVWEPWVPEVGQRVRVRLNGECPCPHCGYSHTLANSPDIVTVTGVDGLAICKSCHRVVDNGHRFAVRADDGTHGMLAAIEMEPVG